MINGMEDSVKSFVRYVNEAIESEHMLCWHECTGDRIGRNELYQKYREHCTQAGMNTNYIDTQNRFGRKIKKYYEVRKTRGLQYYQLKSCDI
jgi:hypothetical protein